MADLAWHQIESSNLLAAAYDRDAGEMHVRFLSSPDTAYVYRVDNDVFLGLLGADSAGAYFGKHLRKLSFRKVPFEAPEETEEKST